MNLPVGDITRVDLEMERLKENAVLYGLSSLACSKIREDLLKIVMNDKKIRVPSGTAIDPHVLMYTWMINGHYHGDWPMAIVVNVLYPCSH
jgi:hypothetical protein